MQSLHDAKLTALVSSIQNNTKGTRQAYPDFSPKTLPRLKVSFNDIMRIAPDNDFENAYNTQQQMRNAEENTAKYRNMYLENIDRQIQTVKLQLDDPTLAKETSDQLFIQLENLLTSKVEQTDPNFIQLTSNITTGINAMKNAYKRKEAEMIKKDYKFMMSLNGDPLLNATFMQLPGMMQSYNKFNRARGNARAEAMAVEDIVGGFNEDELAGAGAPAVVVAPEVAPVALPAGAPAGPPEGDFGIEGPLPPPPHHRIDHPPMPDWGGAGEAKGGEAELMPFIRQNNPDGEPLHAVIAKIPQGTVNINRAYLDASIIFGFQRVANTNAGKLEKIRALIDGGHITNTAIRGAPQGGWRGRGGRGGRGRGGGRGGGGPV